MIARPGQTRWQRNLSGRKYPHIYVFSGLPVDFKSKIHPRPDLKVPNPNLRVQKTLKSVSKHRTAKPLTFAVIGQKKSPVWWRPPDGAKTLATSYFRATYRSTIIGAAAFHFRVRNGNGWGHCARVTRG